MNANSANDIPLRNQGTSAVSPKDSGTRNLRGHSRSRVNAHLYPAIEKEMMCAEQFFQNLQRCGSWRYAAIHRNARFCRDSIEKGFALNGHTGRWIFDLWTYLVTAMPWFLPVFILAVPFLFGTLVSFLSALMSAVVMEEKIIQETVKVPFLWIFSISKTVSAKILVPVIHPPDIHVVSTLAGLIVVAGLLILSAIIKHLFRMELGYRMRLLKRAMSYRAPHSN